jgi:large subunit ribosomal protein L19
MAEKITVPKPAGRALLEAVERSQLRKDLPEIRSGDTVRLHVRIGEGRDERVQPFEGVVIRLHGGGANRTFTVRRIASHGIGVERTFLFNSPRIEKIEVLRHARVRRKQLYYLRARSGKGARLKEMRPLKKAELAAKAAAARERAAAAEAGEE